MSYRISQLFSAVVPIIAPFPPLSTRPTMRGQRTVKTYHTSPTQLEQPEPTLHGHHGPIHRTAGQADDWAAKTTAYQPKYWQQHNNHTRGPAENGQTTKEHTRRETNDSGTATATKHGQPSPYGPQHNPGRADQWRPRHRRTNTSHRAPSVARHPPHRTGRPPQTSEQPEKTTKTTSGYTGRGCSAITPTTHRLTIRPLIQLGTDQTPGKKRPDNEQTARKPANTQPARHARVETGTVSHGFATTCCATPASDHTHERTTKPRFDHSTTDKPTKPTYFEPPTPRRQQLTITGCAHADLRTKEPTVHRSSTRQPRTRQRRQQQKRTHDEHHIAADTPQHQPSSCGNNDATINRPHASRPTSNQPDMQGSIRERRPRG